MLMFSHLFPFKISQNNYYNIYNNMFYIIKTNFSRGLQSGNIEQRETNAQCSNSSNGRQLFSLLLLFLSLSFLPLLALLLFRIRPESFPYHDTAPPRLNLELKITYGISLVSLKATANKFDQHIIIDLLFYTCRSLMSAHSIMHK